MKNRIDYLLSAVLLMMVTFTIHEPVLGQNFEKGDIFLAVGGEAPIPAYVDWYREDGTFVKTLWDSVTVGYTTGMDFDEYNNLYVTNFSRNSVSRYDNDGTFIDFFGSPYFVPECIRFDTLGRAYVTNVLVGIFRYLPDGTFDQIIGAMGNRSDFIDLDSSNDTILYTQEWTDIRRVVISDGSDPGNFTTGTATNAFCLRILHGPREGKVLLADRDNVKLYRTDGTVERTYNRPGPNFFFSLDVNPDDSTFWVGDKDSGEAYKFAIDSGTYLGTLDSGYGSSRLWGIAVFRGIPVFDVRVDSILSPMDSLACLDTVGVSAEVCNGGDSTTTFDVEAIIPGIYGDTAFGITLASGACSTLTFEDWVVPDSNGVCFDLTIRTLLANDINRSNDSQSKQVCAFCPPPPTRHDVGSLSIASPPDTVNSGEIRPVIATLFNFGNTTETFGVTFEILPGYSSSRIASFLAPGDSQRVTFDDWLVPSPCDSSYSAMVYTRLGADEDRTNDTLNKVIFCITTVGADEKFTHLFPYTFALYQNNPNPFASQTEILYTLPKETSVSLEIYDASGSLVRTLLEGAEEAGVHRVFWDGRDEERIHVGSGIYFYKLKSGVNSMTRKLILIR